MSITTQARPTGPPPVKRSHPVRYIVFGLLFVVAGIIVTAATIYGTRELPTLGKKSSAASGHEKERLPVELAEDMPHTLVVPVNVRKGLSIASSILVQAPTQGRPMVMPGSTALDPARVMRVRTRFNAEVVEITQLPDETQRVSGGRTVMRELRPGDRVQKGQVLAVVWSVDVGGRKSDLVDALVQLRLDEQRLEEREKLYAKGSLPLDTLLQTRHDVVSDRNAKARAERTLRTWNIPDHEIKAVYDEAELAVARHGKRDEAKERLWARSELIAPREGYIVERNVGVGEYVADNTINLFTIAEVERLMVIANPPEDQLPALLALKPAQMHWTLETVQSANAPPITGPIEDVGYIIDPNQHTAVVKGFVNNPEGQLRAGQFVSATVDLPPPPNVVEVPLTALAEDGKQSFVFVQPDPSQPQFTMRRVEVTHRFDTTAFVKSRLTPAEQKLSAEEKAQKFQPREPLLAGEHIIASGVLELRDALDDLESAAERR
jgi:cobalt-zinc-cadmium efflux system membrane fusion protein